jgi:DNA-binding MarR family transcriptional regulator
VTISEIGRELGVTRQAASKVVAVLKDRGFVTLGPSPADGREKLVVLTTHATRYLAAQREAAQRIERRLKNELGKEDLERLWTTLDALGGEDTPRLSEYLRAKLPRHS